MLNRILMLAIAVMFLGGCFMGSASRPVRPPSAFVAKNASAKDSMASTDKADPIDPLELQAAVMAFADTTNSMLAQSAAILEMLETPQARMTAARIRVYDSAANIEIAAGPYPGIALLDMLVVSSLRRIVWEDYWIPKVFGDDGKPALDSYRQAEKDIWGIAARIMTKDDLDEMANIILRWRAKNPKQVVVNYVRFDDFGDLGLKPSMRRLTVPGGLFASVKEATMIAEDMKVSIDRAFYLMSRMQLLVNAQIELAYLEMVFQPEADGIIDTTRQVVGLTERYAEIAERLPEDLRGEMTTLMDHIFNRLEKSRDVTLTQIMNGMTTWQGQTIEEVMKSVSAERQAAIDQAIQGLLQQQNKIFEEMDQLVGQSGKEVEDTLNHAFMLGALLIVLFFVLLALYKLFIAPAAERRRNG